MKTLLPLLTLFLLLGCSHSTPPTTVSLTGTPGAPITGYYIRDGRRVDINDSLPITISHPGITLVAVRKVRPADVLKAEAHDGTSSITWASGPTNANGIRLDVADGFSASVIRPDEPLSPPQNSILAISPYWHDGTWVIDDASVGLVKEQFVAGAPEIVTEISKHIPNARSGFRLTFSAQPFPTQQHTLTWLRAESGGNVYRLDSPKLDGWLCPALFKYFRDAPKRIYVRADAKS